MLENSQNQLKTSTKNYISLSGKSRIDSLNDRIQSANEQINTILENPNKEVLNLAKIQTKSKKENVASSQQEPQPQKLLKDIVSDENNKSVQVGLDDNNNNIENKNENKENQEVNKENNNENIENQDINASGKNEVKEKKEIEENNELDIPFIKKTKLLINELKKLKEKNGISEENVINEVSNLEKRAMLELSLSDYKVKKKCELLKKELEDKNNYIKKLENEIVNQRTENTNLKKSENEHLLKISALEDELRVMKVKLLGYKTSPQYNPYHNQDILKSTSDIFNPEQRNYGHIYGENLVRSMWVRDNNMENMPITFNKINSFNSPGYDNSQPFLNNNNERRRLPQISHSTGNMGRMIRNINLNMNNDERRVFKTENRLLDQNEEKNVYNNYNNFTNNERYDNYRLNNDFGNGANSNFQRVSEMILKSPNKSKPNKNFRNEFNRFRIKINNNNTNNNY